MTPRWLVASLVLATLSACGLDSSLKLTDSELIAIARRTAGAREFTAKYPGSQATVDRSGRVAVDFRAGDLPRLRVFVENGRVTEAFVECPTGALHAREVVAAIRACP